MGTVDDGPIGTGAVSDEYDKAAGLVAEGANPWPGMTYVQGVRDALAWVMGDTDEPPLDELD